MRPSNTKILILWFFTKFAVPSIALASPTPLPTQETYENVDSKSVGWGGAVTLASPGGATDACLGTTLEGEALSDPRQCRERAQHPLGLSRA